MCREGDFQRHFVCVFFARRPRKNFARELHEMAQFVLKNSTFNYICVSMETNPLQWNSI